MNLILVGIILLLGLSSVSIYAFTQVELDDINDRNEKILIKIKGIIIDIENQKQIVLDREEILEIKIEIYEQINGGESWNAAAKKKQAKEDVTNAKNDITTAIEQLSSLVDTQGEWIIKAANYQKILAEESFELQQNQTAIISYTIDPSLFLLFGY